MNPKQLVLHDAARDKIRRGVDVLAEAVKVTLGPRGRTVILERDFGTPQIVNSGVLVAKSIGLEDRFESMGAQLLREVASRTSKKAGDGTTTATVLAHGMIQESLRYLAGGMNPMAIKLGIERAFGTVVSEFRDMVKPCATAREIAHVAAISDNNDRSIGDLLASAMDKVGRGFLSPYFINDTERQSAVLQVVSILLCGGRLTLGKVKLADLGRATRAEITKEGTTRIGGAGQARAIKDRIAVIRKERDLATTDYDREKLNERAAKLAGGVALLRARRSLVNVTGQTLDGTSGIQLVARVPEEPFRRIVSNAGDEPSGVLNGVDESLKLASGYSAATWTYGDLLQMGVIDPAKVTRLALQNAASIASLILTTDCLIAAAHKKSAVAHQGNRATCQCF